MQTVHPMLDNAEYITRIILLALDTGLGGERCICETMPAFVGEAVRCLGIVASDPTIV